MENMNVQRILDFFYFLPENYVVEQILDNANAPHMYIDVRINTCS